MNVIGYLYIYYSVYNLWVIYNIYTIKIELKYHIQFHISKVLIKMINKAVNITKLSRLSWTAIRRCSSKVNIDKLEQDSTSNLEINVIDDEARLKEENLQKSRNKSRLYEQHRNILLEINPYKESFSWHHETLKYYRRTYGRYGEASGNNPVMCWPTKEELESQKSYECIAYPYKILDVAREAKIKQKEKKEKIQQRQTEIVNKMMKLEGWKQDLFNRIQKKENEAREARGRKERLIEEVRAHFGYKVDPKDEKFKELLEKKEKEQKKALKEERKQKREEKLVEKMLKKNKEARNEPVEDNL